MIPFGTEVESTITVKGNTETTVDIISNYKDNEVLTHFKRTCERVKVSNKKEETIEYLKFTDMIDELRRTGQLIVRDADPNTKPSFVIEYPKTNHDGSYFIIRTHTALML